MPQVVYILVGTNDIFGRGSTL